MPCSCEPESEEAAEARATAALYARAVATWGEASQLAQLQEECAELIAAVSHRRRRPGQVSDAELAGEIADVEICVAQARMIVGDAAVDAAKRAKLERLGKRLDLASKERAKLDAEIAELDVDEEDE